MKTTEKLKVVSVADPEGASGGGGSLHLYF